MWHLFYTKQSKDHGHIPFRALNHGEKYDLCLTWCKTNSGIQTSGGKDSLNATIYFKRLN